MKINLDALAARIMETVAMNADESGVGVEGDVDEYERWADALHDAIDNGLEAAERRAKL